MKNRTKVVEAAIEHVNPVKKKKAKKQDWREKDLGAMITYVQDRICNPYIRLRDETNYKVSISDNGPIADAGHFYPRGSKKGIALCCQNIHGQSRSGNKYKGGDQINYREGLISRHGQAYVDELDQLAAMSTRTKSYDRTTVIAIGETYRYLTKNQIWVYRYQEFNSIMEGLIKNGTIKF